MPHVIALPEAMKDGTRCLLYDRTRIRWRPAGSLIAYAAWIVLAVGLGLFHPRPLLGQTQADPEQGGRLRIVERVTARQGMVVAANSHAARAGREILQAGGNAVDALAAAHFVLNVVEPQSSGIGGGGFLLIYRADSGQVVTIDGREEAPAAVTPDLFLGPDGRPEPFFPDRITGGRAVGVPGLLKALEKAVRQYGRMSLAQVLAPAIRLAEQGFRVSPRLAMLLARHRERLARFPATKAIYFDHRGQTLQAGAMLRQPDLGRTFRLIAAKGSDAFYRGAIARDIVASVNRAPVRPGRMTLDDLAGYDAVLREPVVGSFRGYQIYGMGPPSSGGTTLIEMMNILESQFTHRFDPESATNVHHFVQAARLAYADRRRYLADPDFVPVPWEGLLDKDYAKSRAETGAWEQALAPVEPGRPPGLPPTAMGDGRSSESASTTHLVAVDRERNVATATSSIEQAFGSGMVVPGRGFFLNNELTDFNARPEDGSGRPVANRVEGGKLARRTALDAPESLGGKRPLSSMAPTLMLRAGKPLLAIGSPGGPRIIQYVAWLLLLMIYHDVDLQSAIESPHVTHLGGKTVLEPHWPDHSIIAALEDLGHEVVIADQNSGMHGVWIDWETGLLHSGVDPRREGAAAGY
ncbi:MAG: gamma-glutamyltransferase [SAR324 cluster bacterium]|nr:gamma-glutamyltransferase [SAR324 cluster bacterium]